MRTTLLTKLHLEPALHPQLNSCCRMIYLLELLALVVQTYLLRLLVEKNSSQMFLPFSDHETQLHLTLLARQPWLQARARQIEDCFGNTAGHAATFRQVWQCGAILVHECQFRLACLGAPKVQRVSCYTCWKHSFSRSCLQAWWKLAGRCGQECRLKGTARRGWVASGSVTGHFFRWQKTRPGKCTGLGRVKSCVSLYVCSNYCKH